MKPPALCLFVAAVAGPPFFASCADSSEADPATPPPSIVLDSATPQDVADAGCDERCETRPVSCAEADFCSVPTGTDPRYSFTAIWGSGKDNVWAVGSGGTALRWDGSSWRSIPTTTLQTFHSVWGSGPTDVWLASTPATVLHGTSVDGGTVTWSPAPLLTPEEEANLHSTPVLTSLWGTAANDVWLGGENFDSNRQRDSQWRRVAVDGGAAWRPVSTHCQKTPPCASIAAVWGSRADDVWAIGTGGRIQHSRTAPSDEAGSVQWVEVDSQSKSDLRAVWGASAHDVWAVGANGIVRHSNGSEAPWDVVALPTDENLNGIWGSSPNDIWIVGDAGTIFHFDGTKWSAATIALPRDDLPNLRGIWGSGPNDVWVVGASVVLHFTGRVDGGP